MNALTTVDTQRGAPGGERHDRFQARPPDPQRQRHAGRDQPALGREAEPRHHRHRALDDRVAERLEAERDGEDRRPACGSRGRAPRAPRTPRRPAGSRPAPMPSAAARDARGRGWRQGSEAPRQRGGADIAVARASVTWALQPGRRRQPAGHAGDGTGLLGDQYAPALERCQASGPPSQPPPRRPRADPRPSASWSPTPSVKARNAASMSCCPRSPSCWSCGADVNATEPSARSRASGGSAATTPAIPSR